MLDFEQKATMRGLMIRCLYEDSNRTLSSLALRAMLKGYGLDPMESEMKQEIAYLASLGFVATRQKSRDLTLVTLTARGVELYEGREIHDGIDIP